MRWGIAGIPALYVLLQLVQQKIQPTVVAVDAATEAPANW